MLQQSSNYTILSCSRSFSSRSRIT